VLPGFALLLLALAMTWPKFAEWWGLKVGACSFAIFLMHQALLELLRLALGSHFPGQPAPFFAVTIGVFAAAFALTYLVERTDWRFGRILLAL
jgi:peptidoglycan/LPS O-acetylase OafA/YrhL